MIRQQIVVGDVRAPVLVGGPAGTGTGEAVVFVHGNPGSGADWLPLLEAVRPYVAVVAPDMPGFGGAEKRRDMDYTVAGYARHLAESSMRWVCSEFIWSPTTSAALGR